MKNIFVGNLDITTTEAELSNGHSRVRRLENQLFLDKQKWCREGGSNPHDLIRVGGF